MSEARDPPGTRRVRRERLRAPPGEAAPPVDRAGDDGVALGVRRRDPLLPVRRRLDPRRELGAVSPAAREHVDLARVELAAELGEPRPVLGDEVEGEAVAARGDRRPHLRLDGDALAGRDERQARPVAVPDDRVVAQVEPVVGEEHRVAPRDGARVLELDRGRP